MSGAERSAEKTMSYFGIWQISASDKRCTLCLPVPYDIVQPSKIKGDQIYVLL